MKLVYLTDSDIPSRSANALHVMKMCSEFAKAGNKVTLITLINKKNIEPGVSDLYAFYGVERNFEIIRIPFLTNRFRKFYSLLIALVAKLLAPDVAYGRNFHAVNYAGKLGMKTAYEGHHFFVESAKPSTVAAVKKYLQAQSSKLLVFTSKSLLDSYEEQFNIKIPSLIVHNGADKVVGMVSSLGVKKQKYLNIGYIGHLYAGKGMEIIAELVKQCPFAFFHIVGGTEKDIAFWKKELNDFSNVHFYGFKPHAETEAYRQEMDVLLAPYLSSVEVVGGNVLNAKWMTPIKLFEYMASGKAIVSSALPVAKEVITNWENGVLCEPEKIDEWIASLVRLNEEAELRTKLGEQALLTFKKDLSWSSRAKKITARLKELL